jgi:hypothetical protein
VVADGEHERHLLRRHSPRDEGEDLRGRLVQPLRVVDQAQQRRLLGDLGQQVQVASPTRNRSGAVPSRCPNATCSASCCGSGSAAARSSSGAHRCSPTAKQCRRHARPAPSCRCQPPRAPPGRCCSPPAPVTAAHRPPSGPSGGRSVPARRRRPVGASDGGTRSRQRARRCTR